MRLFNELKRRNVFKVGVAYAVASWLLLQIVDLVLENINAPDWVMQVFMLGLAAGFPIAIIIAWAFEVTPDGVRLEKNVDRSQSISRQTGQQLNRGIIMILSVLVVFLLTERFRDEASSKPETQVPKAQNVSINAGEPTAADPSKSIAVLPFRDMSADKDQAYFGEGIAEELLNALVKLDGLTVASRTSSFLLGNEDLDIPAIAKRLDVANILEGSIRTSGKQVRVTAQLIDVDKDVHLWSETYDGSLDDIFKIQDEITQKIILAMKVQLGQETIKSAATDLTDNPEAYQLYLKARYFWRQRTSESLQRAIDLFKQAIALDPDFHRAWSNLAIAYQNLPAYDDNFSTDEYEQLTLHSAERALAINPNSSEALTVVADNLSIHCKSAQSERPFQKAIAANPDDPTAHHWYALALLQIGHLDHALKEITIARQIDPLISAVISTEAGIYLALGDYEQAAVLDRQAAELGIYQGSSYYEGLDRAAQGDIENARRLMKNGRSDVDDTQLTGIQLFLDAVEDSHKIQQFEAFIGTPGSMSRGTSNIFAEMLTLLGSAYFYEYTENVSCQDLTTTVWVEAFRQQRGTPEFFHYMEKKGVVDYWREFGWPDDCESLDQTLAECN